MRRERRGDPGWNWSGVPSGPAKAGRKPGCWAGVRPDARVPAHPDFPAKQETPATLFSLRGMSFRERDCQHPTNRLSRSGKHPTRSR